MQPDPSKGDIWLHQINDIRSTGTILHGSASKLAGRLNFAGQSIFGKIGKAFLRPIYDRVHHGSSTVDAHLHHALQWWQRLLTTTTFLRTAPFHFTQLPQLVLYTDATGKGRLGMALYRDSRLLQWAATSTPPQLDPLILQRQTQVNLYELYGLMWGIYGTTHLLQQHDVCASRRRQGLFYSRRHERHGSRALATHSRQRPPHHLLKGSIQGQRSRPPLQRLSPPGGV